MTDFSVLTANKFNPNMFSLARKFRGYTQTQIHVSTSISQAQLSKYEQGLLFPSTEDIARISTVLSFPVEFFFQDDKYFPPLTPFHRKRAGLGKKILERAEALANIRRIHVSRLLQGVEDDSPQIPTLELDDYNKSPEAIAQAIRAFFRLPHGPVESVMDLLEDHRTFIFLEDFETDQLNGFTLIGNSLYPLVFLNKNYSGDAERLTLAHELGHIVMHTCPTANVEEEAWAFATEFMMPKEDIYQELKRAKSLSDYADLKRKWKVSMASLIRRAKDFSIIDENQYRYKMQQMAPYRKIEPVTIPQEVPSLFSELLDTYKGNLAYSQAELEQVMCISTETYTQLYNPQAQRFRLVKS